MEGEGGRGKAWKNGERVRGESTTEDGWRGGGEKGKHHRGEKDIDHHQSPL